MKLVINRSWMISFACAASLILAGGAGASDGVIEINQACAENTGCSSGDGAGFPVDLGGAGTPRSYILTSDLMPTNSGSAMFINGDDVSLDMNGFTIYCSPSSTYGIRFGSPSKNLHVWNGTIVGCQRRGIGDSGAGAHIDRVTVNSSADGGILVGNFSLVENSIVTDSGTDHQSANDPGIRLGSYSIARNNIVSGARIGLWGEEGSRFEGNIVRNCSLGFLGENSTFINNIATENDIGMRARLGSNVIGNTLRNNVNGLSMSDDTTYRGNVITGNTTAANQSGNGQNRGGNTCQSAGASIANNCQ